MSINFKNLKINIHNAAHYGSEQACGHVLTSAASLSTTQQEAVLKILKEPANTHSQKKDKEQRLIALFPDLAQRAHSIQATKAVLTNKNLQDCIFTYLTPSSYSAIHDAALPASWRQDPQARICQYAKERTLLSEEDILNAPALYRSHVLQANDMLSMMTRVSTLDLSKPSGYLYLPSRNDFLGQVLYMIERSLPLQSVRCIDLNNRLNGFHQSPKDLVSILAKSIHLEQLRLCNCNVPDISSILQAIPFSHLTHLDLFDTHLKDTSLFRRLIEQRAPLRHLVFDLKAPIDQTLNDLFSYCKDSLEYLGICCSDLAWRAPFLLFLSDSTALRHLEYNSEQQSQRFIATVIRMTAAKNISLSTAVVPYSGRLGLSILKKTEEALRSNPQSGLGKFYYAALTESDALPLMFSQLSARDQTYVLNGLYDKYHPSHPSISLTPPQVSEEEKQTWARSHMFDHEIDLCGGISNGIAFKTQFYHNLGASNRIYYYTWELAGRPETTDPDWGHSHLTENYCRLADALELIEKEQSSQ